MPAMNESDRQAWVKTLKRGDIVAVESWLGGERTWEKVQVSHITPTGRVKVKTAKDKLIDFGNRGFVRGSDWGSGTSNLIPWSDEFDAIIARRRLVNQAMYYLDRTVVDPEKAKALSDEQLTMLRDTMRPLRRDAKDN